MTLPSARTVKCRGTTPGQVTYAVVGALVASAAVTIAQPRPPSIVCGTAHAGPYTVPPSPVCDAIHSTRGGSCTYPLSAEAPDGSRPPCPKFNGYLPTVLTGVCPWVG